MLPPQGSAEFVCAMEDGWKSISASMGQRSSGLSGRDQQAKVKETRRPRPARPGAAGSYDYELRNGVSNLFMLFAPLEGWRRVEVTERRTKADWARVPATGGRGLPAQGPYSW